MGERYLAYTREVRALVPLLGNSPVADRVWIQVKERLPASLKEQPNKNKSNSNISRQTEEQETRTFRPA